MSKNNRQHKRINLIYYLRIFDTDTGVNVGHLVDITTQGIMMISGEKIRAGQGFSLKMQLPTTINGRQEIPFKARCHWSKKDVNPDFYVSGFQFEEIPPHDLKTITALINAYGFESK